MDRGFLDWPYAPVRGFTEPQLAELLPLPSLPRLVGTSGGLSLPLFLLPLEQGMDPAFPEGSPLLNTWKVLGAPPPPDLAIPGPSYCRLHLLGPAPRFQSGLCAHPLPLPFLYLRARASLARGGHPWGSG